MFSSMVHVSIIGLSWSRKTFTLPDHYSKELRISILIAHVDYIIVATNLIIILQADECLHNQ